MQSQSPWVLLVEQCKVSKEDPVVVQVVGSGGERGSNAISRKKIRLSDWRELFVIANLELRNTRD
jgi:hypothetical protein